MLAWPADRANNTCAVVCCRAQCAGARRGSSRTAVHLPTSTACPALPLPAVPLYRCTACRTEKMGSKSLRYPATYPELLQSGENGGWVLFRAELDAELYNRIKPNPSVL